MSNRCLATSFFLPQDTRFIFDGNLIWDTIANDMINRDTELVLYSTNHYNTNKKYLNYIIPYNIVEYRGIGSVNHYSYPDSLVDKAIIWEKMKLTDKNRIDACASYLSAILEEIKPGLVLCWNMTHPASFVLKIESLKRHIPVLGIEKGFFPETLMVDSLENSYFSDINFISGLKHSLIKHKTDESLISSIKDYYVNSKLSGIKKWTSEKYAVIYAGAYGANILPKNIPTNRTTSKYIDSIDETLEKILSLDSRTIYVLSVHPTDLDLMEPKLKILQAKYRNLVLAHETKTSMMSLFYYSDYGIFIGNGTTQQEYLLLDKPMILMSKTVLSQKSIAYEYDGHNLKHIIESAQNNIITTDNLSNRHRYLSFVFQHYLFGSQSSPTILKIKDLCNHISDLF